MELRKLLIGIAAISFLALLTARGDEYKALEPKKVAFEDLLKETQRTQLDDNKKLTLIRWWPNEYWRVVLSKNPNSTPERIDHLVGLMSKYTLVTVLRGTVKSPGDVTYDSEASIRDLIAIKDVAGHEYKPIDPADIDPEAQAFITAMKPTLIAGMPEPMREHLCVVLFPVNDSDGHPIAEATKEGKLSVMVDGKAFEYRLPLPSLLERKECPKCHEGLPGTYKFCPYDGAKLPS